MGDKEKDAAYVAKALELALSGKFRTYIEVEAAMILLGYPSLVVERPALAGEIDAICNKAQAENR